ncbi:MAG: hypothetical protein ACLTSZ_11265 [Lachnospiraceae bacterium]
MTDKDIADKVYIEPLTVEVVEQLILKEQPDSVLPTLGGQAGLNLAMELEERGFLRGHNVRLIGTTAETIKSRGPSGIQRIRWKRSESLVAASQGRNVQDGLEFHTDDRLSGRTASNLYAWRQRRRNRTQLSGAR